MDKQFYLRLFLTLGMIFTSTAVFAQFNDSEYEDFSNFSTDPVELDQEYHQIFGRFFQSSFSVGTAILTGDLADAYDAGLLLRIMFVYYFDPIWATELGVGFSQHQGRYETTEAGPVVTTPIDFDVEMMLIPIFLGLRYGFNRRSLSRGIATMNPYVSAQVEIVIRREKVEDIFAGPSSNSRFDEAGERTSDTNFGFNIGAGVEFDVYKQIFYLGLDARYHIIFWQDRDEDVGTIGRNGDYVSILVTGTYNY